MKDEGNVLRYYENIGDSINYEFNLKSTNFNNISIGNWFAFRDFDFDGEMQPDVALNPIYQEIYPFSKIVGNANILIMPALHSAAISTKLMKVFGGGKNIGPLLIGLGQPIEVAPLRASTSEILNLASIAAYSSDVIDYSS